MWCGLFWRIFPRPISAFNCCSKTEHQQVRVAPHPRILKLWQARLRGCTVEILTDNQVSVYAQNNQWSSDHFMQYCLREIWLLLALNNIHSSRAPHLWSNQCVSWFFKLSFSWHLRGLRGACGNIPGSPPSFPWWFNVRFHRVLATLAPLSFHIGYLLFNLEQASHIFSEFHSVFHFFIRRSQRRLTVFAAVLLRFF